MPIRRWILFCAVATPVYAGVAEREQLEFITVKGGETPWTLAKTYLNDPQRWHELLPYNPQLSADPTVVLSGMTLRVPTRLVKPHLRAAYLSYIESDVFYKARGKEDWTPAKARMPLYEGDMLRTGSMSRARIKFPLGSVLNLDSHSVVVIRPQLEGDGADLQLERGMLRAMHLKLKASDAAITPRTKTTIYEATIREDRSTKVEVFSGAAGVKAGGQELDLAKGYFVEAAEGRLASPPRKSPKDTATELPKISAKSAPASVPTDLGKFKVDFQSLTVGTALAGFRVQASPSKDFKRVVFDKIYDVDEEIQIRKVSLESGVYWWRVAPVDLLGVTGDYSEPKAHSLTPAGGEEL